MDEGMRASLSAGAGGVYEGQAWEVAGLTPPSVLLAGAAGEPRRVSISHLLAAPGTRVSGTRDRDGGLDAGTVLSGLDDAELARLRERGGACARGMHRLPPWQPGPCPAR